MAARIWGETELLRFEEFQRDEVATAALYGHELADLSEVDGHSRSLHMARAVQRHATPLAAVLRCADRCSLPPAVRYSSSDGPYRRRRRRGHLPRRIRVGVTLD